MISIATQESHTHFLQRSLPPKIFLPWQVVQFYTSSNSNIKGISLFYNIINNKNIFLKSTPLNAWELDLGKTYPLEKWQKALCSTYIATKIINVWEITQKFLLRWYLTPYRISKFAPQTSPICWRGCGATGTLYHIIWTCPAVSFLWVAVFCG